MLPHFYFLLNDLQVILKQLKRLPCHALQHCPSAETLQSHIFHFSMQPSCTAEHLFHYERMKQILKLVKKSSLSHFHFKKFYFIINFKIVVLENERQSQLFIKFQYTEPSCQSSQFVTSQKELHCQRHYHRNLQLNNENEENENTLLMYGF